MKGDGHKERHITLFPVLFNINLTFKMWLLKILTRIKILSDIEFDLKFQILI